MLSSPHKVQIISESGTFSLPKTYTQTVAAQHPNLNTNYKIISIVGAQSSGKSTLINSVFSTDFEVLNGSDGIKQTTKGIWGAMLPSSAVFVMDVEGVDSAERWEEGAFFEKSTSLFSLVLSHLLIINIWTNDVRRFSGSNLKLLQTIFETNFRLFYKKGGQNLEDGIPSQAAVRQKTLIFIFRDFNHSYNLDKIKETMIEDIQKIWQEIVKPEEFKDSLHSQFFKIEFEVMPHYTFERDKFDLQAKELHRKFCDPKATNSYFKPKGNSDDSDNNPVPFDALDLYMKNVWGIIRSDKDLDVPSQKALISEYRCNSVKNDILQEVAIPGFERLNGKLNNIYPDLKRDCEGLIKESLQRFDEKASYYLEEVVDRYSKELRGILKENLLKFLKRQVKLIRLYANTQVEERFKRMLEMFKKKPVNFDKEWNRNRSGLIQEVKEMLWRSDVEFLEYDMKSTVEEMEKEISGKFEAFYKEQLEAYTSNFFKNELRGVLHEKISSLFANEKIIFWEEFNNYFFELWKKVLRNYEDSLKEGFNLDKKDTEKYILQLRNEVKVFVSEKIMDRKNLFGQYVKEIFDYHFTMKDGKKREWPSCPEKEVQASYEKAMDFCARVIDSFRNLEILEHKIRSSQQLGSQDTLVIEDPDFQNLFTDSECHNYKNMLGEYAKPMFEYAKSQCQKSSWIPNLMTVKSFLS